MVRFSIRRWLDRVSNVPHARARKPICAVVEPLECRLVLSAYSAISTLDAVDLNPGDGVAADVNGNATLRAAVMDANALAGSDTITLGSGVFILSLGGIGEDAAATGDLDVIGDLTIEGAGADQTILDAAFLDRFFQVSAGSSLTLRNVTIRNGRADAGGAIDNSGTLILENVTLTGNSTTLRGGAISNNSGSVTLMSVVASNNETRDVVPGGGNSIGGAISSSGGTLTISSSQFAGNSAAAEGGAIDARSGTLQITSTAFSDNAATIGGAVRLFNGDATFTNDTWNGDHATTSGGAIASNYCTLTITGGSFTGNHLAATTTPTSSMRGGSLYLVGVNTTSTIVNITNVTFQETGSGYGGAIYNSNGTVNLQGSVFDRVNGYVGGSIDNGGSMLITNTTIVGGSAGTGGAIYNGGLIEMYNSTINGNASGGRFVPSTAVVNYGTFRSTNNLIAGNILGTTDISEFRMAPGLQVDQVPEDGYDVSGTFEGQGGNLIGNRGNAVGFTGSRDQVGTPSSHINPVLLPLGDNGGPVKTMALGIGSPARDRALNVAPTTDARGFPRSGRTDVGAYEFQNHAPVAGPFNVTINEDEILTGQLPATDEDGDILTYELLVVPAGTLVMQPDGHFSYKPRTNRSETVVFSYRVTDGGFTSNTVDARIVVLPVNDAPVAVDQSFLISENRPNGSIIGPITFTDVESNSVTGEIISGNDGGAFAFNNQFLGLTVVDSSQLNFETHPTFTLVVRLTDDGSPAASSLTTITVNLRDVNEPQTLGNPTFNVDENSPNGTVIGSVPVFDEDAVGHYLFEFASGVPSTRFALNSSTGELSVLDSTQFDFETNPVRIIQIRVTDVDGPNFVQFSTVTVQINNVNEAPVATNQTFSVPENSEPGRFIGFLNVTDVDSSAFTSEIVSGNDSGAIGIDGPAGVLFVQDGAALNFETTPSLSLVVRLTDNGNPAASRLVPITITVRDANEPPTVGSPTFQINENSPAGTVVGSVPYTDVDAYQSFHFEWAAGATSGPPGFALDPLTGEISVADPAQLDYESNSSRTLLVRVIDQGDPAGNPALNPTFAELSVVTINLNDVNEPPFVADDTVFIDENLPQNFFVAGVQAFDLDSTELTFEIVSGNDSGAFVFNDFNGALFVNDSSQLDFETHPVFSIVIRVTDNGSPAASSLLTITVNLKDVNERPVVDSPSFAINENPANGTSLGSVTATDADFGQTLTYSIVETSAPGAFSINPATGEISVVNGSLLNFESQSDHSLRVRVQDNGNPILSTDSVVTVRLGDVNEAPQLPARSYSLAENTANGTVVGTASGTDPDAGQSLTYAIVSGNTNGAFAINSSTGKITVANSAALNFETTPAFNLVVRATDSGTPGLSANAAVLISLTDVNEGPQIAPQSFSVAENTANNTVVGTVIATNSVAGQGLTYAIVSGNTSGAFNINSTTGQIRVANKTALNFETSPTFGLVVRATQNGSPNLASTATITISLTNVNEGPQISAQSLSIAENSTNATVVGPIVASDPDVGQPLNYSITSGNTNGAFAINPATGQLTVASSAALNYEVRQSFSLVVKVADNSNPSLSASATVTVSVLNVNEAPQTSAQSFTLAENATNGTTVGTVSASDPDSGQSRTFAIVSGNTNGAFSINATTGQIKVANTAALNFETTPSFSLTVRATDNGSPNLSSTATVAISLTNVNESPVIQAQSFSLAENSANGTTVGMVTASDPDVGQTRSFAIASGNTNSAFAINATTGRITVANSSALDFETRPTFTLQVRVTDNGSPSRSSTANVTISLTDVVETLAPAIDVIPGDSSNTVRLTRDVEVAILSTSSFNARDINVSTVRFGKLGTENSVNRTSQGQPKYSYRDVNNDGRLDLVVEVDAGNTGLRFGDTLAKLTGKLNSGLSLTSSSSVIVRN